MNNLRTEINGGWPLKLNDIRFHQQAVRDSFAAVFAMFPQDTVIVLTGLGFPSGVDNTVPEGYVYFNGEIYYSPEVDLGTFNVAYWDFTPELSTDSGVKTLQNGDEYQAHEIRRANLIASDEDDVDIDSDFRRFVVVGELSPQTQGYYNALATKLNLVPAGTIMLWGGTLANIPSGWELCQGQMGLFGSAFPTAAPDYRNAFVAGYNAAGPGIFNTLGAELTDIDLIIASTPVKMKIGAYIIKNGTNLPPIFSY